MLTGCVILYFFSLFLYSEQSPISRRSLSNGPVITSNFPDPSLIQVGNTWYAFSTTSGGLNVPIAKSTDFKTWTVSNIDALPSLGAWAASGNTWAPDVVQLVCYSDSKNRLILISYHSLMAHLCCITLPQPKSHQAIIVLALRLLRTYRVHISHKQVLWLVKLRKLSLLQVSLGISHMHHPVVT